MISYRILAQRAAALKAQAAGGTELSAHDTADYLRLCEFTIGMALELYRYEYGHLPRSRDELVSLDYIDAWPGDPRHGWAPLELALPGSAGAPDGLALTVLPGGGWQLDGAGGPASPFAALAAPAPPWLETEARLHGQDYPAYEQHLSQLYPDRMLWPASGVVKAASAAAIPRSP
jgi:hypothetical protein